jgi:glycosyltransferase involved in cell wall biosynthesis
MKEVRKLRVLVVGSKGLLKPVPAHVPLHETGYLKSQGEMLRCYSASDVLVFPTLADNLPVTLLEAGACGLPAVAFNVGGVPDIVRHMETGYLAGHKDAGDLAKGIETLAADEPLRRSMGARARGLVESQYTARQQVRRYEDLYRTVHERRAAHTT